MPWLKELGGREVTVSKFESMTEEVLRVSIYSSAGPRVIDTWSLAGLHPQLGNQAQQSVAQVSWSQVDQQTIEQGI